MGREAVFVLNPVINLTMIILHAEGEPFIYVHFIYIDSSHMFAANELLPEDPNTQPDISRHGETFE